MFYLSVFSFCRDLGAFTGKFERRAFWAFLKLYHKNKFSFVLKHNISFWKKREREIERKREREGLGEKEEEENLSAQGTDSPSVSSYDLSGKGVKLGYYLIAYDYVYVCVILEGFLGILGLC